MTFHRLLGLVHQSPFLWLCVVQVSLVVLFSLSEEVVAIHLVDKSAMFAMSVLLGDLLVDLVLIEPLLLTCSMKIGRRDCLANRSRQLAHHPMSTSWYQQWICCDSRLRMSSCPLKLFLLRLSGYAVFGLEDHIPTRHQRREESRRCFYSSPYLYTGRLHLAKVHCLFTWCRSYRASFDHNTFDWVILSATGTAYIEVDHHQQ